jgi:hypothetical protein
VREGKRKRGQTGEDDEEENRGKENTCPIAVVSSFSEKSTPLRKVRGQTRLFLQSKGQEGAALTPQNTPPPRGKGRPAKTPTTQTGELTCVCVERIDYCV